MQGRLGKVDDAARHPLQIINDILDLTKIEAGKRVLEDTEFSLEALLNLLCNAVKFTQRGFVRRRGELLQEDGARLQVRFEVQDTGEGIAADRQQRLFQAFEQADRSATRRHGGTGLGLTLSRHWPR